MINPAEFTPGQTVYTCLPGLKGLHLMHVVFAFESPYDTGVYYVLRPFPQVRDINGDRWETFEVRSPWQITPDPTKGLPYVPRTDIEDGPHLELVTEGYHLNYRTKNPAVMGAAQINRLFADDGNPRGEDDDDDDDEPDYGGPH